MWYSVIESGSLWPMFMTPMSISPETSGTDTNDRNPSGLFSRMRGIRTERRCFAT